VRRWPSDFADVRVIAVDWSGRLKGAEEFIWLAEVADGHLVSLENGRARGQLIDHLLKITSDRPQVAIGLDFAFSFPSWWCSEQNWSNPREVWDAMAADGERLLAECQPPFWGRPNTTNPHPAHRRYRQTETIDAAGAKSVFQIGGAGAVGTGSVRGMALLRTLSEAGFDIWPFGPIGWPRVIEIYPRALTGPVNKSRWQERRKFLFKRFLSQPEELLERGAGSEDAFDAAVSALVMGEHLEELRGLSPSSDPIISLEGKIWRPT
jgi:predicted nuclease with RNAse H fold